MTLPQEELSKMQGIPPRCVGDLPADESLVKKIARLYCSRNIQFIWAMRFQRSKSSSRGMFD